MTGSPPLLTHAERTRIAEAIGRAEATTSGEIVVLVAARAGLYRSIGLALALVGGLAVPWPLIALTQLSAALIALVQAAVVLAILSLTLDARLRLFFVPRAVRRNRAHEAARREFLARGLTRTEGRSGVLIYVALAERYAEVVADEGVRDRVQNERWHRTVAILLESAAGGDLAGGLVSAVEQVGSILSEELPPGTEGNELPDRVILVD